MNSARQFYLCLLLLLANVAPSTQNYTKHFKMCVSGFCLPKDYNPLEKPNKAGITNIDMEMEILDILKIDSKKFSVTLNIYFGIKWNETRMNIEHRESEEDFFPLDMAFIGSPTNRQAWVPSIFIYNLVSFNPLVCLDKLAGLWVAKGQELFYNQLAHLTFMCPMRFGKFPFDSHVCAMKVGSTSHDETRMTFGLSGLSYAVDSQNPVLDYIIKVQELPLKEQSSLYEATGQTYSINGFNIILTRHYSKYLYIYYLPSALFVITSWVSFLIPPEVVPGRMALLVTLFLVLINIFNNVTNVSPNTEGMTAISSWMLACIFFLFGALMSYAFILYLLLQQKLQKQRSKRHNLNIIYSSDCKVHPPPEIKNRLEELDEIERWRKMARIDALFFYVFPLAFAVFNLIYWPYWMLPDVGDVGYVASEEH